MNWYFAAGVAPIDRTAATPNEAASDDLDG
jgi:hypothetical protein